MANEEHVERLRQGIESWNKWRQENREIWADLQGADLNGADLSDADLSSTNLNFASLMEADLSGADLSSASLNGASLSGDNLMRANLSRANLSRAYLNRADLRGVDLSGDNLRMAKLREANLSSADLSSADLNDAYLFEANLSGANLSGANLSGTNLCGVDLSGAKLHRANLSNASMGGTIITNIDLRTIKGLTSLNHWGPSHIELFSVQLPQDGTALHFLRGSGIPDEWIDYWRVSSMHPIQYHSCFISYSSKDELLASRLHADLQAQGVRCWFAPEDMKIGDKIRQRIDEAIHLQDKLLLLLSEHAVESEWVADEVEAAIEKEARQKREVLFPIRLDASVMQTSQTWAAKLRRSRHIGDFTRWETAQDYQVAFERLLRDLKQS